MDRQNFIIVLDVHAGRLVIAYSAPQQNFVVVDFEGANFVVARMNGQVLGVVGQYRIWIRGWLSHWSRSSLNR